MQLSQSSCCALRLSRGKAGLGVPSSGCPGLAGERSTVSRAHTNLFGSIGPPGNREVKGVLVSDGLNDCGNLFRCCNSAAWHCRNTLWVRPLLEYIYSPHCRAEYLIWKSVVHSLSERVLPNRNSL